MSYDVSLKTARGHEIFNLGNYTSNVSAAWAKALGRGLSEFDGMQASEATPFFREAVVSMLQAPGEYEDMMPDSGWGTYDGALNYLLNIYLHCRKEPDSILSMDY